MNQRVLPFSCTGQALYGALDFESLYKNVSPRRLTLRPGMRVKFSQHFGDVSKNERAEVISCGAKHVQCRLLSDGRVVDVCKTVHKAAYAGVQVQRRQIPLNVCYAETWLSVQGSTYRTQKLVHDFSSDLPWSHGQAYVLFSRGVRKDQNCLYLPDDFSKDHIANVGGRSLKDPRSYTTL